MESPPHVALIIETSKQFGRELLLGIGRYVQAHGPWSVYFSERAESDFEPDWIRDWDGDGIITRSHSAELSRVAQQRGVAVVNVGYHRDISPDLDMPAINSDHHEMGRMVAEHFINRGFRHFGFCHAADATWSEDRRDAFVERCASAGSEVDVFELPQG